VNLSHFTVPDMSQIKHLRTPGPPETPIIEKERFCLDIGNVRGSGVIVAEKRSDA
jgi:hypothetical protein